MKILIGNVKEKNIEDVIRHNIQNGYVVYSDGTDYYTDVLTDGLVYISEDIALSQVMEELIET